MLVLVNTTTYLSTHIDLSNKIPEIGHYRKPEQSFSRNRIFKDYKQKARLNKSVN